MVEQNRAAEAEPVLLQVIARQAEDAEAHRLLATVYAAEEKGEPLMEQLRQWARLTPEKPEAHRALAQVLSANEEAEAAVAEQQLVVRAAPENADDWNDLGALEARAGQRAEARSAFEHALRLDPKHQAARSNLEKLGTHAAAAR